MEGQRRCELTKTDKRMSGRGEKSWKDEQNDQKSMVHDADRACRIEGQKERER